MGKYDEVKWSPLLTGPEHVWGVFTPWGFYPGSAYRGGTVVSFTDKPPKAERSKPTMTSRIARWEKEKAYAEAKQAEFAARVERAKATIAALRADARKAAGMLERDINEALAEAADAKAINKAAGNA